MIPCPAIFEEDTNAELERETSYCQRTKNLKFKMNKMNSELETTGLHCFKSLLEKKIFINKWNPKARYL